MKFWDTYANKNDGIIHQYDLKRPSNRAGIILIYVFMILLSIVFLYPMVWLCFAIFKSGGELKSTTQMLPKVWQWEDLKRSWIQLQFGKAYFYSFYEAIGATLVAIVFNGIFGYVLGVLKPRGSKFLWAVLMAIMLVPGTCNFVISFRMITNINIALGLKATFWPLILGAGCSAFNVMMFKTFFEQIPRDYVEAARLDGAGNIQIFARLILPLSKPIIAVIGINQFIGSWSNFLLPYLLLGNTGKETVMVRLYQQTGQGGVVTNQLRAALFSMIVPIIMFCIFQKQIMNNNTASGVKG